MMLICLSVFVLSAILTATILYRVVVESSIYREIVSEFNRTYMPFSVNSFKYYLVRSLEDSFLSIALSIIVGFPTMVITIVDGMILGVQLRELVANYTIPSMFNYIPITLAVVYVYIIDIAFAFTLLHLGVSVLYVVFTRRSPKIYLLETLLISILLAFIRASANSFVIVYVIPYLQQLP